MRYYNINKIALMVFVLGIFLAAGIGLDAQQPAADAEVTFQVT